MSDDIMEAVWVYPSAPYQEAAELFCITVAVATPLEHALFRTREQARDAWAAFGDMRYG